MCWGLFVAERQRLAQQKAKCGRTIRWPCARNPQARPAAAPREASKPRRSSRVVWVEGDRGEAQWQLYRSANEKCGVQAYRAPGGGLDKVPLCATLNQDVIANYRRAGAKRLCRQRRHSFHAALQGCGGTGLASRRLVRLRTQLSASCCPVNRTISRELEASQSLSSSRMNFAC